MKKMGTALFFSIYLTPKRIQLNLERLSTNIIFQAGGLVWFRAGRGGKERAWCPDE